MPTSTKLIGPYSDFKLSDVNSKAFKHTERFSVAQVGGDEVFSKRRLGWPQEVEGYRKEAGQHFKPPPHTR